MALKGFLNPGDHVVTTAFDHNAVLRPLFALKRRGVASTVISGSDDESLISAARESVTPATKLFAVNHVSNVFGTALPVKKLAEIAHENGALLMLDASQSAGSFDINMEEFGVDFLCAAGHKGLYGPMGTGLLCLREGITLSTLLEGGTGSLSDVLAMPQDPPERYEAGTLNLPGIAGLSAGIDYVCERTPQKILEGETALCRMAKEMLSKIPGVTVYMPERTDSGVFSFNFDGVGCAEAAEKLDRLGILVRAGYHCAYLAHKAVGTENGTVRASFGAFNVPSDVRALAYAAGLIAAGSV